MSTTVKAARRLIEEKEPEVGRKDIDFIGVIYGKRGHSSAMPAQ